MTHEADAMRDRLDELARRVALLEEIVAIKLESGRRRGILDSAKAPHEHDPFLKANDDDVGTHFCRHCNEPIKRVEAGGHADAVWRLVKPWPDERTSLPEVSYGPIVGSGCAKNPIQDEAIAAAGELPAMGIATEIPCPHCELMHGHHLAGCKSLYADRDGVRRR